VAKTVGFDQLGQALSKMVAKAAGQGMEVSSKVYRASGIQLFSDVIERTPVDEGRLRGNWFVSVGSPSSETTSSKAAQNPASKMPKDAIKKKVFLTNNLPYAETVEFGKFGKGDGKTGKTTGSGYSSQAPAGMMRISVRRWPAILKTIAAKQAAK